MLKITVPDFSVQTTLSERDLKPWALELTAFIFMVASILPQLMAE